MPDKRKHRGAHPQDAQLFAEEQIPSLRAAVHDVSWLLSRSYSREAALTICGNRYTLNKRQREAVARAACSDQERQSRQARRVDQLPADCQLLIDGYNLITTIEAALAGGIVLKCRDGCFRDMASMKGTYHRVQETDPSLNLITAHIDQLGAAQCIVYLDSPVSNSGRLKELILQPAQACQTSWQVELVRDPDSILRTSQGIVVTADSQVLNAEVPWYNLARELVERFVPRAEIIDLSDELIEI